MKRRHIALLLILLTLAGCSAAGETDGSLKSATSVTVLSTSGTVDIERSGNTIEARAGMRLMNLDTMQTAAASSSWLTLDEYKAVQLGEQTGLKVDKQTYGFALTLFKGEITAQIDEPLEADESFTVYAGNITLGVRGTIFTVRFDGDKVVTVSVEQGVVAVMDASGNEIDELHEGDTRSYNAETAEPIAADGSQGGGDSQGDGGSGPAGDDGIAYKYTDIDAFLSDLLAAYEANGSASIFAAAETADFGMLTSQISAYPVIHFDGSGAYGIGLYDAGRYFYVGDYAGNIRSGNGSWFSLGDGDQYVFEGIWDNDKPNGDGIETIAGSFSTGMLIDGLWDGEVVFRDASEPNLKYYYDFSNGKRLRGDPVNDPVNGMMYPVGSIFEEGIGGSTYLGPAYKPESDLRVLHGIAGFTGR